MAKVVAALATLIAMGTPVAARFGMPEPLTRRGEIIEGIYVQIMWVAIVVFIIVMALLAWVIYAYREGGKGRATWEPHRHHLGAEIGWTVVPLVIMLWIGVISFVGLAELDDGIHPDDAELEITITASQWNWMADYGEGITVFANPGSQDGFVKDENEFIVPAGKNILLNITSIDVIHALHVMDSNRMTVSLTDANPYGEHKWNQVVVNFEPGLYPVQCREMCFNPGHAYMQARFNAVSQSQYESWLEEKSVCVGASVCQIVPVTIDGAGWNLADNITAVAGSRYVLDVENMLGNDVAVDVAGTAFTVPAMDSAYLTLETPIAGAFEVTANGRVAVFNAVEATPITVDMGNFIYEPEDLELQAGVTYAITVRNVHSTTHDLWLGQFAAGEVWANSPPVQPGESATFIVTPSETGTFEIWCGQAGHYDAGMVGELFVL